MKPREGWQQQGVLMHGNRESSGPLPDKNNEETNLVATQVDIEQACNIYI